MERRCRREWDRRMKGGRICWGMVRRDSVRILNKGRGQGRRGQMTGQNVPWGGACMKLVMNDGVMCCVVRRRW